MRQFAGLFLLIAFGLTAQHRPFDVQALLKVARISDSQISPDGKKVAFTVQHVDLENNRMISNIYVVPVELGPVKQITREGTRNERPRWSPDSKHIAFISDRSGQAQVWLMDPDGLNVKQVTHLATAAGGVLFSPDGKHALFTSEVFPDCPDDACNQRRLQAEQSSKVQARIYTSLLYRHWDHWQGDRRRHIFIQDISGGTAKDLTPGPRDVPPFSLAGPDDYAVSPDGGELCYVANMDPEPAVSTNSDLFVVPTTGGSARKITLNAGADNSPQYSPDGRYIAYRFQVRPGYESDRWRLAVLDRATGDTRTLTEALDRSVGTFTWAPDSSRLFFTVEDRGRQMIQMVPVAGGGARVIASGASFLDDVHLTPDGKIMIYTEQSASRPVEIFRVSSTGGLAAPLAHLNDDLLTQYHLPQFEEFWVDVEDNTRIHSFLLKPFNFRPGQKYPVLLLIHGGPQGAWGQQWSYRWNAQVFAGAGYLVVLPNPRGSTGYGQKFTDEINSDWGGKVYQDIMAVVDHVAKLPYADASRMAAAGGSFGGYMVNWLLGHTDQFKAFVSHAGVFDLRSMFGETEELWFPLWDLGGSPWTNPEIYAKWSPSFYVKEFKTPTLVIHGERDYRVPYGQGLQLFTALQLQKVPSKLLLFPDEGHWILKPQNSLLWHKTFIEWIDTWVKNSPKKP
jgi:dipeptidyl aminopeptidase/acylaminoacyl peptidase